MFSLSIEKFFLLLFVILLEDVISSILFLNIIQDQGSKSNLIVKNNLDEFSMMINAQNFIDTTTTTTSKNDDEFKCLFIRNNQKPKVSFFRRDRFILLAEAKGVAGLGKAGGDGSGGSDKAGQRVPPEVYIALRIAFEGFLLTLTMPVIFYVSNMLLNMILDCFGCGPSSKKKKLEQLNDNKQQQDKQRNDYNQQQLKLSTISSNNIGIDNNHAALNDVKINPNLGANLKANNNHILNNGNSYDNQPFSCVVFNQQQPSLQTKLESNHNNHHVSNGNSNETLLPLKTEMNYKIAPLDLNNHIISTPYI